MKHLPVAASLVALEGFALAVLGLGYGVAGLLGDPVDRTATVLQAALVVPAGLLLLLVGRGLSRARGWALAPAVLVQLLALPVGVSLAQGGVWLAAVPVLLLAASVLYLLATPDAREALRR